MITTMITSWEREKNHIDQDTSLSPEGNYSHMDMVIERVVDGEVQPGGDEGDGDGGGGAHGHGHDHWGQRSLAPSSSLEMVLLWRLISPSRRLPRGRKFHGAL